MSDKRLVTKRNVLLLKDDNKGKYISKFSNVGTSATKIQFTEKEEEAFYCEFDQVESMRKCFVDNLDIELGFDPRPNHKTTQVVQLELSYVSDSPSYKYELLTYRTMKDLADGFKVIPLKIVVKDKTFNLESFKTA